MQFTRSCARALALAAASAAVGVWFGVVFCGGGRPCAGPGI